MNDKSVTINDVINELKRIQVEAGADLEVIVYEDDKTFPAWPEYNKDKNVVEF